MPPFSKLLIANRGEIAVRIIRACRELGIATVAVYSDADKDALHVRMADEAVHIGAAPAGESYLAIQRICESAIQRGADSVHPGYGFLAENAAFAQAVIDAGLVFVGPPPAAIEAMGDKARARELMEAAGVPVVPGIDSAIQRFSESANERMGGWANQIGYPILVKAAAGGGGKGMRIAENEGELEDAVAAARREAAHAFGDDRVILEKYLPEARHVEIQVLADHHGNTIHLNERECSIQRRHQKIIEETPSPLLDDDLRAEMGAAAVAAAQAVGYTNAGTVEFILDPGARDFYFIEMNTRLQVEHPVTELTTGLDLVQLQIRIAAGEPLEAPGPGWGQDSPISLPSAPLRAGFAHSPYGHAIECRLYAEDPAAGFLPAAGKLFKFVPPEGPGIRVDSGVVSGDVVSTHYDPLLAKIIVHAPDRPAAIRRMQTALRETVALGVRTNLDFLQAALAHPVFQAGEATTRFVERHLDGWAPDGEVPLEVLAAAALIENRESRIENRKLVLEGAELVSPWGALTGFRVGERGDRS
jgi:acetyl-CoA carboxylase biotin carboxylase subunit